MDELIILVLTDTADPSQRDRVQRWRAESPENEAYFQGTLAVWSATEPEVLHAVPQPMDPNVIVAAAEERREDEAKRAAIPITTRSERRTKWPIVGWSLAAAAAITGLALGIGRGKGPASPGVLASFGAESVARTVGLDDGSFVRLAPGSTIHVLESTDQRRIEMTGRAFFAVARDESRPFVVSVDGVEARVLGTRFEVAEEGDGLVRAVVVDGRVAVANRQGLVEVPAGGLARATKDTAPVAEMVQDVYALLDWPGGVLLYQGTPLTQVADEVGRFFGREVEVQGERLRALRITGSFDGQSFEEVVLALCEASGAACALTDAGASIAPRP